MRISDWATKFLVGLKNYGFQRSGILAPEMVRFGLAACYIIANLRYSFGEADSFLANHPASSYDPKGILLFFGQAPPSEALLAVICQVAIWSPIVWVLGWKTRWVSILVFLSNLYIRSLGESYFVVWSHGFNVVFLAHLAFLFAPVGQYFSIDSWLRKRSGITPAYSNGFWAVLLGQWAVSLMFFNAFYWKVIYKPAIFQFRWANSDSLRNHLVDRYIGVGETMPDWIDWIASTPWAWKSLAWGNLVFQLMPFLACFMIRRPVWRLLFGLGFIVEELGLSLLMGLSDLQWLPLIVFFVDWDYFAARWNLWKRPKLLVHEARNWSFDFKKKCLYAGTFLGIYLVFAFGLSRYLVGYSVFDLKAYPFSQFAMYSQVKVYGNQKPQIDFTVAGNFNEERKVVLEKALLRSFYNHHVYSDPIALENNANRYLTFLMNRLNSDEQISSIEVIRRVVTYSPVDKPPGYQTIDEGLVSIINGARQTQALAFKLEKSGVNAVLSVSGENALSEAKVTELVAKPFSGGEAISLKMENNQAVLDLVSREYYFMGKVDVNGESRSFMSDRIQVK